MDAYEQIVFVVVICVPHSKCCAQFAAGQGALDRNRCAAYRQVNDRVGAGRSWNDIDPAGCAGVRAADD